MVTDESPSRGAARRRREDGAGQSELPPHLDPLPQRGEEKPTQGPNRSSEARDFARELRRDGTSAEKRLWRVLRGRRFHGFKFRRQYPCGIYFLDFYCVEARLAVELDGGGHGFPERHGKDAKRDEFLASQGIRVLRFWNHKVRQQIDSVRFEIWYALMERTGQTEKIAHFVTSKRGGGGGRQAKEATDH